MINKKPPLTFLLSFGHSGIDWLHSLLDSHPQILILPAIDYYLAWKLLEADKITNSTDMINLWCNYINSPEMQGKDTKLFYSEEEFDAFNWKFKKIVNDNSLDRISMLWAIHTAFAYAKNIQLDKIKNIVLHVHTNLPFNEIIKDFPDPNILMIIRDPRACFAGWFKIFTKKFGDLPDYYSRYVDETFEEWMFGYDILYNHLYPLGSKALIVKNEDMVENLEKEMRKVAKWMQIDFNESMLTSTYPSGLEWIPDSGYISKEGQYPEKKETYFLPENVKRRWLGELNDQREILMIEFLTFDIMKEFGYKPIYKKTLFNKMRAFWYYLLPHRGPKRLKYYKPDKDEFSRIYNRLNAIGKTNISYIWKFLPILIKTYSIWCSAVVKHFVIYFFPGDRWRRYDIPGLEHLYRDY